MVGMALELLRHDGVEPEFDRERRRAGRERDPVRHPEHVGIDRDDGLAPDGVEHDVGGLPTHARQRLQKVSRAGHHAPCCRTSRSQSAMTFLALLL